MLVFTDKTAIGQNSKYLAEHEYSEAKKMFQQGNYEKSEKILLNLRKKTGQSDTLNRIVINNLLGIIYNNFGNFKSAFQFYSENINLFNKNTHRFPIKKSKTLNNIGNIYLTLGQYSKAVEYYNQAITVLLKSSLTIKEKDIETDYIYYNSAIVYFTIGEYQKANAYYQRSLEIKQKNHLKGIDKVYFNMARTYEKLNDIKKANSYYKEVLILQKNVLSHNNHNSARIDMFYGNFLTKQKNFREAKFYLQKAKTIYEQNYGMRHPYTANSYVYLGMYYSAISKPDSALYWYQKSLIANSKQFNSADIRKNPSPDDCLSQLQLLKGLKMKAQALINSAQTNKEKAQYLLSLKTVDCALRLISTIRKDYISSENKLIITEIEKECYSYGVAASMQLYGITKDKKDSEKAYQYAYLSKASVLKDMFEEDNEMNLKISPSEKIKKTKSEHQISGYKKLIYEENEKQNPNSLKIQAWQSKLFEVNNEYDVFIEKLKIEYHLTGIRDKKILSISDIQQKLPEKTTLAEYFISKDENSVNRDLYIFVITKTGFRQFKKALSPSFEKNISIYSNRMNNFNSVNSTVSSFNNFNKACFELYRTLFEPVKEVTKEKNIIIVPDEEIAYISFDALLSAYKEYKQINYADLHYLIFDYCFSYAYSTSLLLRDTQKYYSDFVYAFAPVYNDSVSSVLRQNFGNLSQTQNEINSILKIFKGKAYIGPEALEDSFKIIADKGGIIHLAGHASLEEKQKEFSFLAFSDKTENSAEDGLLFAYEIERTDIRSPMVVLSACNTGKGRLYSGEGVYSLSRSFLKAGASSVIYSLWNVNDDSGSEIMHWFYDCLSKGEAKNTALRNAKLKYLETASPEFSAPVYWGNYVLSGNTKPVINPYRLDYLILAAAGFLLFGSIFLLIIRRRQKVRTQKAFFYE